MPASNATSLASVEIPNTNAEILLVSRMTVPAEMFERSEVSRSKKADEKPTSKKTLSVFWIRRVPVPTSTEVAIDTSLALTVTPVPVTVPRAMELVSKIEMAPPERLAVLPLPSSAKSLVVFDSVMSALPASAVKSPDTASVDPTVCVMAPPAVRSTMLAVTSPIARASPVSIVIVEPVSAPAAPKLTVPSPSGASPPPPEKSKSARSVRSAEVDSAASITMSRPASITTVAVAPITSSATVTSLVACRVSVPAAAVR